MSKFVVRVELHQGNEADYGKLHNAMKSNGFTKEALIQGSKYHLPDAEYFRVTPDHINVVLSEAEKAAKFTGRSFKILVIEADNLAQSGLLKV